MNRIKRKEIIKTFGVFLVVAVMTCALALPQPVSAAPTAPNWLPGQPMLAGNQIIAMWLPVPGAVKYIVYLDGQKVAESPANQYMGLAPEAAGVHTYEVVAVDPAGAQSPKGKPGLITIVMLEPPTGTMIRPNPEGKAVGIRWVPSKGAVISNIYRADTKDGPWKLLDSVQGSDSYKDSGLEYDREYWYAITAKDITGKETARSVPEMVKITEPKAAAVAVKLDLVVTPSSENEQVRFFGSVPVSDAWGLDMGEEGDLWVATGEKGTVIHLSPEYERLATISLRAFNNPENNLKLQNADRLTLYEAEDLVLVVDQFSSTLVALDLDGALQWTFKPALPPEDRDDIWQYLNENIKNVRLVPNATLLTSDGLLLVTEVRAPIFYVVDFETGELLDWLPGYVRDGEHFDTIGAGVMKEIEPGLAWAGEPLVHRVVAFDPETMEVKYVLGEEGTHDGFIAGFLGVSDFALNSNDGSVLVADSGVGAIQAFDPKTGKYLYHIGGTPAQPDPKLGGQRPTMDMGAMTRLFFNPDGSLWVKHGFEKYFSIRTVDWGNTKSFKHEK